MTRAPRQRWGRPANGTADYCGSQSTNSTSSSLLTASQHQQNLSTLRTAIIVMLARTNTLLDLRPLIPDVLQTLLTVKPGQAVVVGE